MMSGARIPFMTSNLTKDRRAYDFSRSLQFLPMRSPVQDEHDDTNSYSNNDFASNNEESSSSIQEFQSMPNVPIGEKSVPAIINSQDASESEDSYSMDDDFVTSSQDERSNEDPSSPANHTIEGQSICDEPSAVTQPHSQILGNNSQSYHVEISGSREPQHGSCDVSTQSTQMQLESNSDAGYIGEVKYTPNASASTTHLPVVQEMIQQPSPTTPMNEKPKIACSKQQCRVSFDPICVFIATKSPEGKPVISGKPQNGHQHSKKRLNELSQPIKHKIFHTPEKSEKPNMKSPKVSTDRPNFLERMKTIENEKRVKLQRAAAEAAYNARVDKVHLMYS